MKRVGLFIGGVLLAWIAAMFAEAWRRRQAIYV